MTKFWLRLSRRERWLVIATAVILVMIVARYAAVGPFLERRNWVKTQLEVQPRLLEKNMRYIGRKEQLLAALESARNQIKTVEPMLLAGDTPSVTASDLQETVQALASKEGTQVITTRVLNPETAGTFSKIAIQLEIGGQIEQVANLIRGIETAPKMLVVDEVNIRSLFRPIGVPQPQGIPPPQMQNLRVSLTVAGFTRASAAAPDKTGVPSGQPKTSPENDS